MKAVYFLLALVIQSLLVEIVSFPSFTIEESTDGLFADSINGLLSVNKTIDLQDEDIETDEDVAKYETSDSGIGRNEDEDISTYEDEDEINGSGRSETPGNQGATADYNPDGNEQVSDKVLPFVNAKSKCKLILGSLTGIDFN